MREDHHVAGCDEALRQAEAGIECEVVQTKNFGSEQRADDELVGIQT